MKKYFYIITSCSSYLAIAPEVKLSDKKFLSDFISNNNFDHFIQKISIDKQQLTNKFISCCNSS